VSEPDDDAAPEPVAEADASAPVTSGGVVAPVEPVEAVEPGKSGRAKRISQSLQGAVSGGVTKLGEGIGALGEGVVRLGELTDKVPLVGAGVSKLGEGIAKAGGAIERAPIAAKTRRGRLLVRSAIVGFLLVAAWITIIVGWQVRANDTPDFRPDAERILVQLSQGSADYVYEHSSPRFQEIERKERFVEDMTDMITTVGKFREITAINKTIVTTGPTGKLGRVSLTAAFDKGVCAGSISFHYDDGEWKLIGVGVELPPELKITAAQREQRAEACKEPMNPKTCDLYRVADGIFKELRDGHADKVWDAADATFKDHQPRKGFIDIQRQNVQQLGAYRRILDVTEAKISRTTAKVATSKVPVLIDSASYELLAEFEKSSGVRAAFGFQRNGENDPWVLHSFKIVLPMPRAEDEAAGALPATKPQAAPPDAGAGARDASRR